MRGHGFIAVAENIERCIMTAVYAQKIATIQTIAINMNGAQGVSGEVRHLSEQEASDSTDRHLAAAQRPWDLWCREVDECPLYINNKRQPNPRIVD